MEKRTSIPRYLMMGISCLVLIITTGAFTASGGGTAAGEADISQVEPGDTENDAAYTMSVESAEPGGVTFTIVNNTDEEVLYGTDFVLKQYSDNDWVNVQTIITSYRFNKGFYSIPAHSSATVDLNWEWLYSTLSDGEYMISKTILEPEDESNYDQVTLYADFVLDTQ